MEAQAPCLGAVGDHVVVPAEHEVAERPRGHLEPEKLEAALKALANPARVRILGWLKDVGSFPPQEVPAEEVGVCLKHIQARAGVSQSTASQYLASLAAGGLVKGPGWASGPTTPGTRTR